MRLIKFRAWNKLTAQVGSALPLRVWTDDIARRPETYHADMDNLVLMQFTGLKDKNGWEIYEGDIVEVNPISSSGTMIGQVVWINDGWFVSDETERDLEKRLHQDTFGLVKVVGNIYENPELLR